MNTTPPDLAPLHAFYRSLPAVVGRLHQDRLRRDPTLLEDLRQEVALDYLANLAELQGTAAEDRHRRWLRLVGRCQYDLWQRGQRLFAAAPLDELPARREPGDDAPGGSPLDRLGGADAELAAKLLEGGVRRKNGRINLSLTARSFDLAPSELRCRQKRLAAALGNDARFVGFWRRRLVEALLGLAADVLRDRGLVSVTSQPPRRRPDPAARLQRLRRIRDRLRFFPLPADLRRVLSRYGRKARDVLCPRRALHCARMLDADRGDIHLWLFELAVVDGDPREAAAALRAARACGDVDRGAVLLARARLLEARRRPDAAAAVLERGRRRFRDDPRLVLSLRRLRA